MTKKIAYILLLFKLCIATFNGFGQASPGGFGTTNLTAWFRADGLTTGNVLAWTTTFPTGGGAITVNDPASPYSQSTNSNLSINNLFNYNQYISFSGNAAATQKQLFNTTAYNLMSNANAATDQSSYFAVFKSNASTDCVSFWHNIATNSAVQLRGWGRFAISDGLGNSAFGDREFTQDLQKQIILSYKGNRNSATSMTGYRNAAVITASTASQATGSDGISFGAKLNGAGPVFNEYFTGDVAEFIFMNKTITVTEEQKIHSYLATKYGVTLPINYINSSAIITYSNIGTYTNNIIGIARDDNTGLLQKQSHNVDDSARIYKGTLATTNSGNISTFSSDISYVVMGDDDGNLCNASFPTAELPPACPLVVKRIQREWKVTKTNHAAAFNVDIKLNSCASLFSVTPADLVLLVDNDGNFSNGGTNCYFNGDGSGIVISYANPVVTFSNVNASNIPNNSTRYITLGSKNNLTPLPVELISFDTENINNEYVKVKWATASEKDNDFFTIERSVDAMNWEILKKVNGAANSTSRIYYEHLDLNPYLGLSYYRLKQTDINNSSKNSPINYVTFSKSTSLVVYPNPSEGEFTLMSNQPISINDIKIFSMFDQELTSVFKINSIDKNRISLSCVNLPKGTYILKYFENNVKILIH